MITPNPPQLSTNKKGREETSLNLLNQSPRNLKVNPVKLTFITLKLSTTNPLKYCMW